MDSEKQKILIVDDEDDGRNLIKSVLKQANYDITEATNGEEALKILRCGNIPDLIVLDVQMPKMDGYKVCYEIRNSVGLKDLPIIMLTVLGDTIDKVRGLHMGVDDYMTKPFENEEFLARINSIFNRKKQYEEWSMKDGLTGLYNVHFFKNQIKIFVNMAKREAKEFSLAIIDIDKFKKINDKYGHAVGDHVLKKISTIMEDTLRKSDIITRYGGDEFAVILPKLNKQHAKLVVDKLIPQIHNENFSTGNISEQFTVSVSIGIASWKNEYKDDTQLFEAADADMYKNKQKKNKK